MIFHHKIEYQNDLTEHFLNIAVQCYSLPSSPTQIPLGEAICHAVWLKNRYSTRALGGHILYQTIHQCNANMLDLYEFGAPFLVCTKPQSKSNEQAKLCYFLGYDSKSKGYQVYWPENWYVSVEWNVTFTTTIPSVPISTFQYLCWTPDTENDPMLAPLQSTDTDTMPLT